MKQPEAFLTIILISLLFLLSGCNSIIFSGNIHMKGYEPEPVPSIRKQLADESDAAKIDIKGKKAFYILEGHESDLEKITDFKLLDLIDGNTTVYAYISPLIGQKEKKATVLMSYNTDNGKYHIFFNRESSETERIVDAEMQIGVTANKAGENYFLYCDGIGYLFDKDGRELFEENLTEVLNENVKKYKYQGNDVVTISDVVMDPGGILYIPMVLERSDSDDYEDLEEDDLMDETSGIRKILCCCFRLNIGKDNDPPVYFVSYNLNAGKQEELWCGAGKEIKDGKKNKEDTEEGEEERLSMAVVKEMYPDKNDTFLLNRNKTLLLCGYEKSGFTWWSSATQGGKQQGPVKIVPENLKHFMRDKASVMIFNPVLQKYGYIKNNEDNKINYNMYANGPYYMQHLLMIFGQSGQCLDSVEIVKKKIQRTCTVTVESVDEDGTVTETETEQEEEEEIVTEHRLFMRENTELFLSTDRYTSDMIAPGADGPIYFGTEANEEYSYIDYVNKSGEWIRSRGTPGHALSAGTSVLGEGEAISLFTSEGIAIFEVPKQNDKRIWKETNYFIPYKELDILETKQGSGDVYNSQSLEFFGSKMLVTGLRNGIVLYDTDSGNTFQLSSNSYFMSEEMGDKSLAAIGFQEEDGFSGNTLDDLPEARIYKVEVDNEKTALQMVKSKLQKEPELEQAIRQGKNWEETMKELGIKRYRSAVMNYFLVLQKNELLRQQGISDFCRLAGIRYTSEIEAEVRKCRYLSELEDLMYAYNRNNKEYADYETQSNDGYYQILQDLRQKAGLTEEEWQQSLKKIASAVAEKPEAEDEEIELTGEKNEEYGDEDIEVKIEVKKRVREEDEEEDEEEEEDGDEEEKIEEAEKKEAEKKEAEKKEAEKKEADETEIKEKGEVEAE